jgi:sugar lactone lactonase YvrE
MHICGLIMISFYKVLQIFFSLFLIVSIYSCKDSPVDPPPDNKPPGYQEDISWPSLGSSAWPTKNADMQRTGRSKYTGPQQGIIFKSIRAPVMQTGAVFANDSVFYYTDSSDARLVAAKIDGTILWTFDLQAIETFTTPLVDNTGTIYVGGGRTISAVNPDGSVKWVYQTDQDDCRGIAIGLDGILYVMKEGPRLLALDQNGNLLWSYQDNDFGSLCNLAFSPDGNTLYVNGSNKSVVAVDVQLKTVKWKFGTNGLENGPLVDSKGNIYLLLSENNEGVLYCLSSSGSVNWRFTHSEGYYTTTDPTIDKEGNIYFATDTLYSLNYLGEIRWKLPLNLINVGPIICDMQGTVYLVAVSNSIRKLLSVSKEGTIKWELAIPERSPADCPALGKDGTMILPSFRARNLFIIK